LRRSRTWRITGQPARRAPIAAAVRNRFYPLIAVALALVTFVGFSRTFYLSFLFDVRPLTLLVHLHGIVFTAWVLLFIAQTRFIAANNYVLHRKVGIAGAVLAALIVIVGVVTAIVGAADARPRAMGFNGREFLIFPFVAISMFAGFATAAIGLRRRPDLHKRLMVMAMIAVVGPAVARILRLVHGEQWFLTGEIVAACVFVGWALINDWAKHRIVHPVYLWGGAFVIGTWPLRAWIASTDAWERIAIPIVHAGSRLLP
jgi:hypothetical protein